MTTEATHLDRHHRHHAPRRVLGRVLLYVVLIALAAFYVLPMYWMLRSSLMTSTQIASVRPYVYWPQEMLWHNYVEAMTYVPFLNYFLNTMYVIVLVLAGTLLTSTLAAFAFSRIEWRGRDLWFAILMTGLMLPSAVTIIPTYIGWSKLSGINTFWPLTLPAFFGGGIFNIFLLRQFFHSIPRELDEAAFVDGASYFQIYLRVIVPLARPAVIVVALFRFLDVWNDYFGPILYLNDPKKFTLAIGLLSFRGQYATKWNLVMAASTVVVLPCIIIFLFGQKQLIEGIALTGLKG